MKSLNIENHVSMPSPAQLAGPGALGAPFLHAPEAARTVFLVTLAAACGPLLAGLVVFGWRAGAVAAISIASCAVVERVYYRVTRTPALLGRTHAYLTGLLLALTLPPHVPWYVPAVAGAFAIIVGKGIFGGVGHFLWQPALVGRLAVSVMFPAVLTMPNGDHPGAGPVLAQNRLLIGDVRASRYTPEFGQWQGRAAPQGADAFLVQTPSTILKGLTSTPTAAFGSLAYRSADSPRAKPAALMSLPSISSLIYGATPGGIGETCVAAIVIMGLYLVYRNYVKLLLPLTIVASAGLVAAVAPIRLAGLNDSVVTVWWPLLAEGLDVGLIYVCYQLLSGGLFLAAFFLAAEMTTRPVTSGGQAIFAVVCGVLAMLLKLYVNTPIPTYMAVLAANTLTPVIDAAWRPRVLGQKRLTWLLKSK